MNPPAVPPLPDYAQVDRSLRRGRQAYLALLPKAEQSPALHRIAPDPALRATLLSSAAVLIQPRPGYAFVDVSVPCIVLAEWYYREGSALDLYLDLLHEFTHLRQLTEGLDLWDERFAYVDRPTEIEGYAVAVEEGMRLGMTEDDVLRHLANPWMTSQDVARLRQHIDERLASG